MALIIEAINADNAEQLHLLFERLPEQRIAFTPFAGGTWLHYAAKRGSNAAIQYMLNSGMDINVGDRWDGANALCFAAQENRIESIKVLIDRGIALDVSTLSRNALFSAVVGRSPDAVKLILGAGIDARVKYDSETMHDMDAVAFALMRGERACAEIIARWNNKGGEVAAQQALSEADEIAEQSSQ